MASSMASSAVDPDPTTQIAWPSGRKAAGASSASPTSDLHGSYASESHLEVNPRVEPVKNTRRIPHPPQDDAKLQGLKPLTKWNLFTLSLGMAGAQVAWTVELGYGTPFLLDLGLSEQLTSLVWLAGPISGLIAQPVIGAISDSSSSRYRRRFWIGWSTVVLVFACLALAYAQDAASVLVDIFGGGVGDWDPKRLSEAKQLAIGIAITAFYLLDFALNALQASLRNLLLDVTPPEQLSAGNAWHGRMTHAGNIIGFGFGFMNLAGWPVLRMLGGSQFRKFCVVGIVILVVTVWVTCWTQDEPLRKFESKEESGIREVLKNIRTAILKLPKSIQKVCFVQIFAFMAWFPFLFYALRDISRTTYIGQVMAYQDKTDPDVDVATRAGNFALLMYSLVAVVAGSLLPELTKRDERLLEPDEGEDEERELARIQRTVTRWKAEARSKGKSFRLPRLPFCLRDIWSFGLALYGVISFCTFFIETVTQATVAVALIGICWAVAVWAPFAMIMEFLKEIEDSANDDPSNQRDNTRNRSTSPPDTDDVTERTALLERQHTPEGDMTRLHVKPAQSVAGGTVLGIHNLAIVFPQFIVSLVASLIFRIVDQSPAVVGEPETIYLGKNGVAWVLRFGGLSAFLGAIFARLTPTTKQERRMRRQLGLMREALQTLQESSVHHD
ncbi:MFS general substrate transporter [Gautieria morchelliformis]|nr:MFS general substrate transporter [Gautieria morchelliformis]